VGLEDIARKHGRSVLDLEAAVERAKRAMTPRAESFSVVERGRRLTLEITRLGVGRLKTAFGHFEHFDFRVLPRETDPWEKYSVIVLSSLSDNFLPNIFPSGPILVRVDSGCETGQLFGDKTCECREQLDAALRAVATNGSGVVISIPRQDGRGMGLPFKLATLTLQLELGVDTVEASSLLEPIASRDTRTYAGAVGILRYLGAQNSTPIRLLTNNPKKLEVFEENGFVDLQRVPLVVPSTPDTEHHLAAKQKQLGHMGLIQEPTGE
jgi:GTP cyclohydrolase II